MKYKKRKIADFFAAFQTYFSALLSLLLLGGIIVYVLSNGASSLSWEFISSDYKETLNVVDVKATSKLYDDPNIEGSYFSEKYGVSLKDAKTVDGNPCVQISYLSVNSPFLTLNSKDGKYAAKIGENLDLGFVYYF